MKKLILGIIIGMLLVTSCAFVMNKQNTDNASGYMTINSVQEIGHQEFYVLTDSVNNNICYLSEGYHTEPAIDCISNSK